MEPSPNQHLFCRPSWELPCFKTTKRAISRVRPSFLGKSRVASGSGYLFVFINVESSHTLRSNMLAILTFPGCSNVEALLQTIECLKISWEPSTGIMQKCKTNAVFFASNPYRLWSFQLGAENISKVVPFSENTVFYKIKLNYCSVHNFRGARILIYLFACRLARFMHENCGALHWDFPTSKNHGLFFSKCTASRECNGNLGWLRLETSKLGLGVGDVHGARRWMDRFSQACGITWNRCGAVIQERLLSKISTLFT